MKKLILLSILSLTVVACDRNDKPNNPPVAGYDADNTAKNVRDRNNTVTPADQSESEADRVISQKIRQALVADDSLSTNAKNVKVITINGIVTLRGPVSSAKEKDDIARKVYDVQGITRVDNQLEITRQ